jgi:hypothetical protein
MKTSILLTSALVVSFLSCTATTFALNVPKPMAIDIDDLGWKEGWDLHEVGGPYRLGLPPGRVMTLQDGEHISSASVNGRDIACYHEERGFAYILLPRLERRQYTLTVTTGTSEMPAYVWNDGTYNVEEFQSGTDNTAVRLEMYGTQRMKVKLRFAPREVTSNNIDLEIRQWRYEAPFLSMLIRGRNIQGQRGVIAIERGSPREQR